MDDIRYFGKDDFERFMKAYYEKKIDYIIYDIILTDDKFRYFKSIVYSIEGVIYFNFNSTYTLDIPPDILKKYIRFDIFPLVNYLGDDIYIINVNNDYICHFSNYPWVNLTYKEKEPIIYERLLLNYNLNNIHV